MATSTTPDRRLLTAWVAVLGLIDDLGDGAPRGLRGARQGDHHHHRPLKAIGTATLAAATTRNARETATITLATHVFNVLNLRPGPAAKVFAAVLMATRSGGDVAAAPLLVIGVYDPRERAMLGDTGAALLGAIAARHLPATARTIAALTAIALVAELTSLTARIDQVPPLRALDWLGRRKPNA